MPKETLIKELPDPRLELIAPVRVTIQRINEGEVVARLQDVALVLEGHGTSLTAAKDELAEGIVQQYYAVRAGRGTRLRRRLREILHRIVRET